MIFFLSPTVQDMPELYILNVIKPDRDAAIIKAS